MSQPHTLPDLPYPYDALQPYISEKIMKLHHSKHHKAYVDALNDAEKKYISAATVKERIALQAAVRFNGGGHINHSLFWTNLAPCAANGGVGGVLHEGPLKQAIVDAFGSVEKYKEEFNAAGKGVQGSGWVWLGYDAKARTVAIVTTANQDPLTTHVPLYGVDVWEHAYYLDYENRRPDYLNAIWNVINFKEAEARLLNAAGGGRL